MYMETVGWRVIEGDVTSGVVVVVDFVGSRQEEHLLGLASRIGTAAAIVQPELPRPGSITPELYASAWLRQLRHHDWDVRMVLGYCGGGALACDLAEEIAESAPYPKVVLFDPYLIDAGALLHEYRSALGQYESLVAPETLASVLTSAQRVRKTSDLRALAAELDRGYRALSAQVLGEMGVDDEIVDELCGRFVQHVDYLVACAYAGYSRSRKSVVTLLSQGSERPPLLLGSVQDCEVPHDELLRSHPAEHATQEELAR